MRSLSRRDVEQCIGEIFARNVDFCDDQPLYAFNDFSDEGESKLDASHAYGAPFHSSGIISVGMKSLLAGEDNDGFVFDKDAVWCVAQAFHESAHLWQHCHGYVYGCDDPRMKPAARCAVLCNLMLEYKKSGYLVLPSELHANMYAVIQTKAFFEEKAKADKRYGVVDVDTILCDKFIGTHGKVWPRIRACRTCEELGSAFSNAIIMSPGRKKVNAEYMQGVEPRSKAVEKLLGSDVLNTALTAENGYEETDVLCKWAAKIFPKSFNAFPCIKAEYVGLSPTDKLLRHAVVDNFVPLPDWRESDGEKDDKQYDGPEPGG